MTTKLANTGETNLICFTELEIKELRGATYAAWNYVADDALQAVADDKGKNIDKVSISRSDAIELALDAGRMEQILRERRRTAEVNGKPTAITDDLLARWDSVDYKQKIKIVKPAFQYTRYGM